jgi:hypothetical protein
MFRLSTVWLQLATALLLALFIAGCSSSEDDGGATGGAAAASRAGGDEATERYKLTQAFDMSIEVTSPVFSRIRRIPKDHSCGGGATKAGQSYEQNFDPTKAFANSSPPLEWTGVPEGTVSIALVMDSDQVAARLEFDPKAGAESAPGNAWTHWMIWNIPADSTGLPEGVATTTEALAIGPNTRQGVNDDKTVGYSGPCPPPVTVIKSGELGTPKVVFSYFFHVYALDIEVDLGPETTKDELLKAIDGHVLAGGEIKGEFVAKKNLIAG